MQKFLDRPVRTCFIVLAAACGLVVDAAAGQRESDQAVVESLLRLGPKGVELVRENPGVQAGVDRYLESHKGQRSYLNVVSKLELSGHADGLASFLTPDIDGSLQAEAIRLLIRNGGLDVLAKVLSKDDEAAVLVAGGLGLVNNKESRDLLKSLVIGRSSSALKIAATAGLGRAKTGQEFLLQLARNGDLPSECKFPAYNAMMTSANEAIRSEAEKLLKPEPTTTGETLPPIRQLVRRRGDGKNGKLVFNGKGTCGNCHKVHGKGKEVGPDLSEIGSKLSREAMYVAILNPNAGISHNYEQYSILTVDGLVLNGLLVSETDNEITLKTAEGVERTTTQDDVEEFIKRDVSLMPENLHKSMSVQELLDLVDYLVLLKKKDEKGFHELGDVATGELKPASREAADATEGIDVADGLAVKLFSSEPDLFSPSNIDVDHLGRVWVCEVVNYRHFRNPYNEVREEGDRILVLEDTDGNGQCDKQTVFYQGRDVDSAHGICVLGDRVIVSAGDSIFALAETDGDLKADDKQVLFTGISGADHDHGIHAVVPGPDGKLYFNFGNEGHQLKGPDGKPVVDRSGREAADSGKPYRQGMVFRCDPDGSNVETLGWNFRNPWELCVDSFGTIWQSDNDDDGNRATRINYVMQHGNYGYVDEVSGARWSAPRTGMHDDVSLRHWHLNDPGVVPNVLQTGAGSPTGIMFYEGDLLPREYRNGLIHCDPGPNSVRVYSLSARGAGYNASQAGMVEGTRDKWFRPVDVSAAPDGSLFIADWYDPGVGGHRMGDTKRGRLFRVTPSSLKDQYSVPKLIYESVDGAIAALRSPNTSARYLAAKTLREMGTKAESALHSFYTEEVRPELRARALWVLGSIDARKYVQLAMANELPDLRVVGVRIAVQHGLDVTTVLKDVMNDPSPKVRRELALSLHGLNSKAAAEMWARLAVGHRAGDRWYLEALGIGADGNSKNCFDAWKTLAGQEWNSAAGREIVWRMRSPDACELLAELIGGEDVNTVEQLKYFRAFDFHPNSPSKQAALVDLATRPSRTASGK
ncbi:membrane-bound dehydrogenase domain-containing protein [Rhodopirellula maiorica SM1]|uniref:Membrane-bound dehydrogenase domain-containing protein n=1 Tax=Rhodopirellula maiorica SM1 TaxID=1265738 RepID=M5S2E7_9BACT|nr:PVC-type heme-binding CxxCH protein [Rhodopirellula maiorica]EMI21797.1 membrane-bound dehydrogenase domain-containing protein [Rhodopirellula maiorica SM1]